MLRNVAISLLVFVSASLAWSVADGAWVNRPYTRCEAEVDQRLNRIDVDRADIEKNLLHTAIPWRGQKRPHSRGGHRCVGAISLVRESSPGGGRLHVGLPEIAAVRTGNGQGVGDHRFASWTIV